MTDSSKRLQDAAVALALAAGIVACPAAAAPATYNLEGILDQMKKGPHASDQLRQMGVMSPGGRSGNGRPPTTGDRT